ncbi:hypothetical protein F2Q69_00054815 [Brassica cretica]|uniref:Uncharacterized protein n=1 Tax=Brassica cretica TaxID=69181 RepID=A0A8S9MRK6_BRACR|nr:hypothetical protein F2Q69_00054815 [Brassica cretica]
MQCHLWFPIPELIVQLLNRFNLSISQVNPCGLQHIIGILVPSYELGITLELTTSKLWLRPDGMPRWKRAPSPSLGLDGGKECPTLSIGFPRACSPRIILRTSMLLGGLHPEAGPSCCCAPPFPISTRPKKGRSPKWMGLFHM